MAKRKPTRAQLKVLGAMLDGSILIISTRGRYATIAKWGRPSVEGIMVRINTANALAKRPWVELLQESNRDVQKYRITDAGREAAKDAC